MVLARFSIFLIVIAALAFGTPCGQAEEVIRIATYNVENYITAPGSAARPIKSAEAAAAVCSNILALKPDLIALEEMGDTNALFELQIALKSGGLDLPFWELVRGFDTNIHIAILSRLSIVARRPQTNDSFLLAGRRFHVSRGFAEVDVQAGSNYSFTLIAAHLKSKRTIPEADEADLRLEEAKVLREHVDKLLTARPALNLVVMGDLNDSHDSQPIKTILGRGRRALTDLRPVERADAPRAAAGGSRTREITWTYFYAKDDSYSRIDYILMSQAMVRGVDGNETFVLAAPDWGIASDHRPLLATIRVGDH